MSKADEFERLARMAAKGEWIDKRTPPLKYEDGPAKGFSRYDLIAMTDHSCSIFRLHDTAGEAGISPSFTADFLMWCANNRALIARALRTQEMIDAAIAENDIACGSCGEFFSGDPPTPTCKSARNGKHSLLVHLDLEKVPK